MESLVAPALNLLAPIYTPGYRETVRTKCLVQEKYPRHPPWFEPRPLDPSRVKYTNHVLSGLASQKLNNNWFLNQLKKKQYFYILPIWYLYVIHQSSAFLWNRRKRYWCWYSQSTPWQHRVWDPQLCVQRSPKRVGRKYRLAEIIKLKTVAYSKTCDWNHC